MPIRRIAGWAAVDGNPLRRGLDRAERAAWMLLLLAFVIAAPVVVPLAGHAARVDSLREVSNERSWREVNAILLKHAPQQMAGYDSAATIWVPGRWRAPAGATRYGFVPAEPGAQAGAVVKVWVSRAGQLTGVRPLTAGLVGTRVIAVEVLVAAGLLIAMLLLAWFVRWLTNRRRMAHWAIEWACFEPRWSARP